MGENGSLKPREEECREILELYQRGDLNAAWARLDHAYRLLILSTARRRGYGWEAEDLTQETLLRLHERFKARERLPQPTGLTAWVHQNLGWRGKDHRRREGRFPRASLSEDAADLAVFGVEDPHEKRDVYLLERLKGCISQLAPRKREAVLRWSEGDSYLVLQTILGTTSPQSVRGILIRVFDSLSRCMESGAEPRPRRRINPPPERE